LERKVATGGDDQDKENIEGNRIFDKHTCYPLSLGLAYLFYLTPHT